MIKSRLLSTVNYLDHSFTIKYNHIKDFSQTIAYPTQMHGNKVFNILSNNEKYQGDGLITSQRFLPIGVITADCVPLIFLDPVHKIIAVAHSGWKGTLKNISSNIITTMKNNGACTADIMVAIGPSIKKCCYDILSERAKKFTTLYGTKTIIKRNEKLYIDLQEIIYLQLISRKIKTNNIDIIDKCTYCNPTEYYSYHRGDRDKKMISYVKLLA